MSVRVRRVTGQPPSIGIIQQNMAQTPRAKPLGRRRFGKPPSCHVKPQAALTPKGEEVELLQERGISQVVVQVLQ